MYSNLHLFGLYYLKYNYVLSWYNVQVDDKSPIVHFWGRCCQKYCLMVAEKTIIKPKHFDILLKIHAVNKSTMQVG